MQSCQALQDYAEYVNMVRENRLSGADLNAAVEKALDEAVSRNLLNGYFNHHRARIKAMSLTEYDEEEAKKVFHDDGYNEGRVQGRTEGMAAQKAEDERLIKEQAAELEQKEAELAKHIAEIARLKALLENQNN